MAGESGRVDPDRVDYWRVRFKDESGNGLSKTLGVALTQIFKAYPPNEGYQIVMTKGGGRSSRSQYTIYFGRIVHGLVYNELWGMTEEERPDK